MGGGSNWEEYGSLLACKGYERASENAKKGVSQKAAPFNQSVYEAYAANVRDALDSDVAWITKSMADKLLERTPLAVVTRAKKVKAECLVFDAFVQTITSAKPTGDPKEEDIENAALAIYNKDGTAANMYRYLRGDESPIKPFPFKREYAWIKGTSAFILLRMRSNRQSKAQAECQSLTSPGGDSASASTEEASDSSIPQVQACAVNVAVGKKGFKRPLASKKTGGLSDQNKAIAKGSDGIASMANAAHKRVKLGEEALSIERKKVETESIKTTMQLFAMDGCCPDVKSKVLKMLQERALANLVSSGTGDLGSKGDNSSGPTTHEKAPYSDDELEEDFLNLAAPMGEVGASDDDDHDSDAQVFNAAV